MNKRELEALKNGAENLSKVITQARINIAAFKRLGNGNEDDLEQSVNHIEKLQGQLDSMITKYVDELEKINNKNRDEDANG